MSTPRTASTTDARKRLAENAAANTEAAVERASRVFGWQHLAKYSGQTQEWLDQTLRAIVLAAIEARP